MDGEGGNLPSPQGALWGEETSHEYLLLRAGDKVLETGKPLTWRDCFSFLADLPTDPLYVSYFFDYDVTMMIRTLTPERLRRLIHRSMRTMENGQAMPLDVAEFQIDYLPGKEFKVRRATQKDWVVVSDTGGFFQSAFLKTLTKWGIGTEEELAQIAEGKAQRANFGALTDETRYYNDLECRLLAELMTTFRSVCRQLGYVPSRFQGAGDLATAMLRKHKTPKSRDLEVMGNNRLMLAARSAYYGGRFEIGTVGPIRRPVEQWDINSAYPAALVDLPCLVHGHWEEVKVPNQPLYVSFGLFKRDRSLKRVTNFYGFPVRGKVGNIYFPGTAQGWYWSHEISTVLRHGYQTFQFERTWQYRKECNCSVFAGWVPGLYNARKRLGKDAKGFILKLGLNSLYGKMAQSIGNPTYANPISAGLITSHTRAKLLDAIYSAEDPMGVHMLATDGVFADKGNLSLDASDGLGGWERTELERGLFIIQPGLYFANDTDSPKTRGVPQAAIVEHKREFEEAFTLVQGGYDGTLGRVTIPLTTFVGAKLALHQQRLSEAGEWQHDPRTVTFDWRSKRRADPPPDWVPDASGPLTLYPFPGKASTVSVPYSRTLGVSLEGTLAGIVEERYNAESQPDWVPYVMQGDRA